MRTGQQLARQAHLTGNVAAAIMSRGGTRAVSDGCGPTGFLPLSRGLDLFKQDISEWSTWCPAVQVGEGQHVAEERPQTKWLTYEVADVLVLYNGWIGSGSDWGADAAVCALVRRSGRIGRRVCCCMVDLCAPRRT